MKTWQTQPNCHHHTIEKLYCCECKKQHRSVVEILDIGFYCLDCFTKNLQSLYGENDLEYIMCKLLEDVDYDIRKEMKRKQRSLMTLKLRYIILKRDNFKCVICGNTSEHSRLEIDHIIPVDAGGKTTEDNLQTLCFKCNHGKGIII